MNLNKSDIESLEEQVLSCIVTGTNTQAKYLLDRVVIERWSHINQQFLLLIKNHVSNSKTNVQDFLISHVKPELFTKLTQLINDSTPFYLAKEQLEKLQRLQEESQIKSKLRKALESPIEDVRTTLTDLSKEPTSLFKPRSLGESGSSRAVEWELEANCPSTGYVGLDYFVKGFVPGHVYVLSGDTNAGKSTMALNFAHRVSAQNKKVLYFALEPENTIVDYLASIRLKKRFSELVKDDILFDDPNINMFGKDQIRKIEDLVKAVKILPRYDLIEVDHIGYFTGGTSNVVAKQSDVMKELAGLAKEKLCAILLIQHLNKGKSDNKSPENNITGSAAFKQDATDVLMLSRDKEEDAFGTSRSLNTGAILIRKSKTEHPQGAVKIRFVEYSALVVEEEDAVKEAKAFIEG